MAALPLTPRLVAWPGWGLLAARAWLVERSAEVVAVPVSVQEPLPPPWQLRALAEAPEVRAVHLQVQQVAAGWATLSEARAALLAVKEAGKLVVVELDHVGNAELYLASVADRVWMRPVGELHALGVAATLRFAGDALARLGLTVDLEAAGAYKSFGETFRRSYASPENREATASIVAELQEELEAGIAAGRRLDRAAVRAALLDAPLDAEATRARGLVDAVGWPDQVGADLDRRLGGERSVVPFARWWAVTSARDRFAGWMTDAPVVAVVHLRGTVVDGEGAPGGELIAAHPVARTLARLREDDDVVAVVLAIRSPGGSAAASDLLWRAVSRLQERKPVVACFGDVAASGGYYLAAPAAEIVAAPTTLTGSIGVVGGKVVYGEALARLGVHAETVLGAPRAAMLRADRPFDAEERARFRTSLERFYRTFLDRVAGGRRRPVAAIEPVARGRVWTGRQALAHGLVDHLGGTTLAVERAQRLAGARDALRVDLHARPPGGRLIRLARRWLLTAVPEAARLPRLSASTELLLDAPGAPLAIWPWDLEVG